LINGEDLLKSRRFDYLKNVEFAGHWDPNPFYANVKVK